MSSYWCNIQCPFFVGENDNSVTCEGIKYKTQMKLIFERNNRKAKRKYRLENCEQWPNECPIAKMLSEKWEEKE